MKLLLLALFGLCFGRTPPRDPAGYFKKSKFLKAAKYQWSEEYLDHVAVDHFSFGNRDEFSLRYFINTTFFRPGGPILFYTGNEGSLEGFAENTGFMWDLAPQLNGAVVFAEHRFYGKTKPYGNDSYTSTDKLGYLSSEQALADFVILIDYLKAKRISGAQSSPVVAFGGSYGGMLAAWLRIKYPHKVVGAIAASAPVFWFVESKVKEDIYDTIVTRAFVGSGCNFDAIRMGWTAIQNLSQTTKGRTYLNTLFKLDPSSLIEKPEDSGFLTSYIREAFEGMAMVNYPYSTEFLAPLPGWPVKEACKAFANVPSSDEEVAKQMYSLVNLYYNYTGTTEHLCANPATCSGAYAALGDPLGWPWQSCTEMVMPLCSSGPPNDFFWKECPFSVDNAAVGCKLLFGTIGYKKSMIRPFWPTQNYGTFFPSASNIVFTNGYLDPWSGGGWAMDNKVEGSLVSIILKQGAHHYDLRGEHPDDTDEVKKVRQMEKNYIQEWIKRF